MDLPSKDEIKKKYKISENDFEILAASETPTPMQLQLEQAYLEKAGWWNGSEVWIKRFFGGVVKAVMFIGSFVSGAQFLEFDHYLVSARDEIYSYVQKMPDYITEEANRYLILLGIESQEDQQHRKDTPPQLAIFPTGTLVAPATGSYQG